MNLNKLKLILVLSIFSIFLFGCSDNNDNDSVVSISETSSVSEIEFEKLDNLKEVTAEVVNKYSLENNMSNLEVYFDSIKDNFDDKTYNSNFNLKTETNLESFKRNYVIDKYDIVDVFYDSLSEKGILKVVYIVNVQKDFGDMFENVVITEEQEYFIFKYSLEKNKIVDFKYYSRT